MGPGGPRLSRPPRKGAKVFGLRGSLLALLYRFYRGVGWFRATRPFAPAAQDFAIGASARAPFFDNLALCPARES